ncbi:DUF3310 domain-containing protein [Adlercreutzia sp. ZJ141]|uniref:DUF3310 domain-containing protein n=1 Tax=Adlercreutzia sp. ZJ141 TaxID=2709406 RepID=UPI0013ED6CEF|nr:DUF3310 domain-containing protein [Adlercreutzia sp. ZJ141]
MRKDGTCVRDMVEQWLQENQYDGLSNPDSECGCGLDDLMPCRHVNPYECVCAYEVLFEGDIMYCTSNASHDETSQLQSNDVTYPSHYTSGGVECKDALKAAFGGASGFGDHGLPAMVFYWWGCAFKYLWRWNKKNGIQDLQKCKQCIDLLIDELEE